MSENTKKSLTILGVCLITAFGPLVIISVLSFAALASIIGESRLEDPVTGLATPLGSFVVGIPYAITAFFVAFGTASLLAEFVTKGKTRLALAFFKWYEKQSIPWATIAMASGIIMIVSAVIPFTSEEAIGADIGTGLLLIFGLATFSVAVFLKSRKKHKKR